MKISFLKSFLFLSMFIVSSWVYGEIIRTPSSVNISGTSIMDVYGFEGMMRARDASTVNTYTGADIAWLYAYDNASINVNAGEVSWLYAYDNANITVNSGEMSWLFAYDNVNVDINGGDVAWLKLYGSSITTLRDLDDLSWLLLYEQSEVNIYGRDFSYEGGQLSGYWEDGTAFSFWALDEANRWSLNKNILPKNIFLNDLSVISVAEPPVLFLLFLGMLILLSRKMRTDNLAGKVRLLLN